MIPHPLAPVNQLGPFSSSTDVVGSARARLACGYGRFAPTRTPAVRNLPCGPSVFSIPALAARGL